MCALETPPHEHIRLETPPYLGGTFQGTLAVMTASAQRPRCQAHAALTVLILTRSCLGFAPSLASRTTLKHATSRWRSTTCPLLLKARRHGTPDEDDGEELVGMAEFLARKAERDRQSGEGMANRAAASSVRPAGDEDDGDELVGMAEFLARKAERDRQQSGGGMAISAMSSSPPAAGEEDGEELVGMAEFLARKAGRDRHSAGGMATPAAPSPPRGGGVDFNGGIFPSDVFPAAANDDITLREERFEPGQPEALVGFWKVRRWTFLTFPYVSNQTSETFEAVALCFDSSRFARVC